MLNVGWMVRHRRELFDAMKANLACPFADVLTKDSTKQARVAWFEWLADKSADEESYNIHAIWLWYFESRIEHS